jgi:hypothetical protein
MLALSFSARDPGRTFRRNVVLSGGSAANWCGCLPASHIDLSQHRNQTNPTQARSLLDVRLRAIGGHYALHDFH